MLLNQSTSPVCAVGPYSAAVDAHAWLTGAASSELLTILSESAGHVCASPSLRLLEEPGPSTAQPPMKQQPDTSVRRRLPMRTGLSAGGRPGGADQVQTCDAAQSSALPICAVGTALKLRVAGAAADDCLPAEVAQTQSRSPFAVWSAQAASMADALDVDDPASDFSAPSGASGVSRLSLTQKLSTSTPGSHQAHGCTSFVNTCHPAVVPVRRATPRHPHSHTAAEGSPVLHKEKMLCPAREQMPGAARGRRQDGRQQHWSGMTKVWTKAVLRFH